MAQIIDIDGLVAKLKLHTDKRVIIGIAGAPGSGKSTMAAKLEAELNGAKSGTAAILPMDGFHYDDHLLTSLNRLQRKGAPDTFDVGGFRQTLERLRANDEAEVAVPVFDRDLEISRGSARLIARAIPVIIVEGNYLLLKQHPWSDLKPKFDFTVMVEADIETLRQRLMARWQGYNLPADEIRRKVEENDLPNARFVVSEGTAPDYVLSNK